jgi:hypothetical protein
MSCIKLNDLSLNLALDRKAMAAIRGGGGGAPWIYGWIQPYVPQTPSIGPVVNLYEVSNNFYANQMINQFQSVDVRNTGANSNINVSPDARNRNDMVKPLRAARANFVGHRPRVPTRDGSARSTKMPASTSPKRDAGLSPMGWAATLSATSRAAP